mmetsp:Transcript_5395/g.13337  ORF Transcript_5395/g.13337 Transcript_5395/m.13337 type:complete len:213 (-) Transcript_5395:793-1431(-)
MPGWLLRNGRLHSLLSLRPNRQHHRDAPGQRGDPRTTGRTAAGVRAAGRQRLLAAHAAATQSHAYPRARDEAQHAQPRRLDELPSSARSSPFCNHLQRVRGARAPPPRCHRGERAVHAKAFLHQLLPLRDRLPSGELSRGGTSVARKRGGPRRARGLLGRRRVPRRAAWQGGSDRRRRPLSAWQGGCANVGVRCGAIWPKRTQEEARRLRSR